MTDYLQQWLQRKAASKHSFLGEPVVVTHIFHVHTGPRFIFGEVTLSAKPAETFSFISKVNWPEKNNDDLVLDGILDVLLSYKLRPILGAIFTLTAIGWHDIDSVPMGYYYASKEATKRVLRLDEQQPNIAISLPDENDAPNRLSQ